MKIYLIGSLRNKQIPIVASALEAAGHEAFADWYSPGPDADKFWHEYEKARGRDYFQAINGPHAWHVFAFDKKWLDWADAALLVLPAGKSGHIELGYMAGQRKKWWQFWRKSKKCYVLFDCEPERYDIMYRFADGLFRNIEELVDGLK